jgi:hypothetical protein
MILIQRLLLCPLFGDDLPILIVEMGPRMAVVFLFFRIPNRVYPETACAPLPLLFIHSRNGLELRLSLPGLLKRPALV